RPIDDMSAHQDQRWPFGFAASRAQRLVNRLKVVAVGNRLDVPAICLETARAILGEGDIGPSRQRHAVVVIEVDQLSELKMAGKRGSLRGYALHQVPVADDP